MYKSLNDAPYLKLKQGPTEIWYMRPEHFREGIMGAEPDPNDLEKTHVLLGTIQSDVPEDIFFLMQGENWSPRGEANQLILDKGLKHTSMSVGDVIVIDNEVSMVDFSGFREIGEKL